MVQEHQPKFPQLILSNMTYEQGIPVHTGLDDSGIPRIPDVNLRGRREKHLLLKERSVLFDPVHCIADLRLPLRDKIASFPPYIVELSDASEMNGHGELDTARLS